MRAPAAVLLLLSAVVVLPACNMYTSPVAPAPLESLNMGWTEGDNTGGGRGERAIGGHELLGERSSGDGGLRDGGRRDCRDEHAGSERKEDETDLAHADDVTRTAATPPRPWDDLPSGGVGRPWNEAGRTCDPDTRGAR